MGLTVLEGEVTRHAGHVPPHLTILDPGAGEGAWGHGLVVDSFPRSRLLVGVERRPVAQPQGYDRWVTADYLEWAQRCPPAVFDLVVGNPPYDEPRGSYSAELFIRASLRLLKPGGFLLFLLKLTFLQSRRRADALFLEHPPVSVTVCKSRPRFTGPGNPDSYAFYCWRKGFTGEPRLAWI